MSEVVFSDDWEQQLAAIIRPDMLNLSEQMYEGAKSDCPVDTGNLQRSIYATVENDSSIELGATADYAIDVECGHHIPSGDTARKTASSGGFVAAEPFLRLQLYKRWRI